MPKHVSSTSKPQGSYLYVTLRYSGVHQGACKKVKDAVTPGLGRTSSFFQQGNVQLSRDVLTIRGKLRTGVEMKQLEQAVEQAFKDAEEEL